MSRFSTVDQLLRFQPTPEAAADVLAGYTDPDQTLSDIARRFHTTPVALANWLNSPEVEVQLDSLERATTRRTRFIASANQRLALAAILSILDAHQHDEQHIPVDPQNLKAVTQRDRRRAAARLAASQLLRLSGSSGPSGTGPGGTGVSPVLSAQRPHDNSAHPRRTPPATEPHIPPSQAGRLCHQDRQTTSPPNPEPSPAHPITSSPHSPAPSTHHPATPCFTTQQPGTRPGRKTEDAVALSVAEDRDISPKGERGKNRHTQKQNFSPQRGEAG